MKADLLSKYQGSIVIDVLKCLSSEIKENNFSRGEILLLIDSTIEELIEKVRL